MGLETQQGQPTIVSGVLRLWSSTRSIKAAPRHAEKPALLRHRHGRLLRIEDGEFHVLSFAKKAVIFMKKVGLHAKHAVLPAKRCKLQPLRRRERATGALPT